MGGVKEAAMERGSDALTRYRRKRDFRRTPEPGGEQREEPTERSPRFVVQVHDASSMHFDFRLEADGVLKSWAIPKGPSDDPSDKRLAMPTEDHPLEYREFEGVVPPGQYGSGTVIVWDEGTYSNLSEHDGEPAPVPEALAEGHLSFALHGRKLHGGYALTRIRKGDDEAWLLVKRADRGQTRRTGTKGTGMKRTGRGGHRTEPVPTRLRSVLTGRTLKQVAAGEATGQDEERSGRRRAVRRR
jgi:DNA ligase D-like protein (predicted 3'-phosphoesterase)